LLPLLVYAILILMTAAGAVGFSILLGWPRHSPYKDTPYESGIAPTGDARIRLSIPFYMVAIFFILFDVEIIFLIPWAVRLRQLSWPGFTIALVFIMFLLAGLVYVWLRRGLVWRHLSKTASSRASSSQS
jgi:NADH-quinone oxidoreductase subunit A